MKSKVVYVSLDERNCNYYFPRELGCAAGLDVLCPPEGIMSKIKQPCDSEGMWAWLEQNIRGCSHAVLSLDMLVYGSLINSRRHALTRQECIGRLNRLARLKALNPMLEIHAFNLIMRTPNYDNSGEEPDYWADYGKKIWKYSWLCDKKDRAGLSPDEDGELQGLQRVIPGRILEDNAERRRVNLSVNVEAVRLVKAGVIDRLVIPKDDNSEFGFSMRDQAEVYRRIEDFGVRSRVYIYPGADEVGCTLMCRVLNLINGTVPKVHVQYSSTFGPEVVAKYEDRPINESVKWQVLSSGAMLTNDYHEADIVLMVNTPGKYMIECADQWRRDHTYMNFRNLDEFVQKLKYFVSICKRCIVADIAYPNGADNELMQLMMGERLLNEIFAYGGWNTTANTLGVVILQGTAAMALSLNRISDDSGLHQFHIKKLIEDWAYQANVLNHIAGTFAQELGFDSYSLGNYKKAVCAEIVSRLNGFLDEHLFGELLQTGVRVAGIELPWERVYDVIIRLE